MMASNLNLSNILTRSPCQVLPQHLAVKALFYSSSTSYFTDVNHALPIQQM